MSQRQATMVGLTQWARVSAHLWNQETSLWLKLCDLGLKAASQY